MKKLFLFIGLCVFFMAFACNEQPGKNMSQNTLIYKDSVKGKIHKNEILKDSIPNGEIKKRKRINNEPQFYTTINDFDSLGRPYMRWIEFIDTLTGEVLNKIDIIEQDNPYVQSGVKIDFVDENGPNVYYDLGKVANKVKLKPFLPAEEYHQIPEDLFYSAAMSFVQITNINNNLIVNYSFEWGGLEREWIRGEYITHSVIVYDEKGKQVYSNTNAPGMLSYISPSKNYLFFTHNKHYDDWEKQTGCLNIFSVGKREIIYTNCRLHSEWFRKPKLLGEYVLFVNCKRNAKLCDEIMLFQPFKEKFNFIKKEENEDIRFKNEKYILVNKLTKEERQLKISDFEILNKK